MDLLRSDLVAQLDVHQISVQSDALDVGPHTRDATTVQTAATMKFADVDAVDSQFFNNQTLSLVHEGHSASLPRNQVPLTDAGQDSVFRPLKNGPSDLGS
jgi:hypothetical protein